LNRQPLDRQRYKDSYSPLLDLDQFQQ